MQSYRFDAFSSVDDLHLHEEEKPEPRRGEVLLRVRSVSLNYRDIAMVLGRYPSPSESGHVPTSDASAEVVAVGENVTIFKPGDRVISVFHPRWFGGAAPATLDADTYGSAQDGWLTQYKVVSQEAVLPVPDGLSWDEAATLPCAAATAWCALAGDRPVRAGQTVLTLGTGGVSIFAVQLAKALGARVIATTSGAEKAERLRALGADEVVNYQDVADWGARVRDLADGRGVDRVIEVGGPATINQSLKATTVDGEVVLVGFLGADNPGIDYFHLFRSGARIRSIRVGDRANLAEVVRVVSRLAIKPVIDKVFAFDDAKSAFRRLEAAAHVGKILIRVAD